MIATASVVVEVRTSASTSVPKSRFTSHRDLYITRESKADEGFSNASRLASRPRRYVERVVQFQQYRRLVFAHSACCRAEAGSLISTFASVYIVMQNDIGIIALKVPNLPLRRDKVGENVHGQFSRRVTSGV